MVLRVVTHARTAVESQVHQTKHVKGRHQRGGVADIPENAIGAALARPGFPENRIFRKESGEGEDARNRKRRNEHGAVSDGNTVAKVSHVAHVLLAAHGVNDGAGAQEEQRFEEGMSKDVEDAGREGSNAKREKHVSKLRDAEVCEDAITLVWEERNG